MGEIASHAIQGTKIPDDPDIVTIDLIAKAEQRIKERFSLSDTDAMNALNLLMHTDHDLGKARSLAQTLIACKNTD